MLQLLSKTLKSQAVKTSASGLWSVNMNLLHTKTVNWDKSDNALCWQIIVIIHAYVIMGLLEFITELKYLAIWFLWFPVSNNVCTEQQK